MEISGSDSFLEKKSCCQAKTDHQESSEKDTTKCQVGTNASEGQGHERVREAEKKKNTV